MTAERKQLPLRLDPAVHDALARWAADELRSVNAQIEILLRRALAEAGRMPARTGPVARRGRPKKDPPQGEHFAPTDGADGADGAPRTGS